MEFITAFRVFIGRAAKCLMNATVSTTAWSRDI